LGLSAGTRIGPYEITGVIGAGGMGEVYRARDPRLGRELALKVLPEQFAVDASRRARFEQEARAASALNHPNIVTIYEIGELESTLYVAMELVEGRTLRTFSRRGRCRRARSSTSRPRWPTVWPRPTPRASCTAT
jgi:serine/threonine protein kinase